jgi:hypothetical protein
MKDVSDAELDARIEANMLIILIGSLLLIFLITASQGPTLIDEPCAPSHPVIVDNERVGCTGDGSTGERWYPGIEPDYKDRILRKRNEKSFRLFPN